MKNNDLESALSVLVAQHGYERVHDCLHKCRQSDDRSARSKLSTLDEDSSASVMPRRSKPTALEYVAKMELPPEKERTVAQLAERFHEKSFLPSFRDITNFCQHYDIEVPASRSRASALPRVFKFIASMEPDNARKIVEYHMFCGPSSLGPIADAIRRNGRARSSTSKPESTEGM